MLYVVRAELGYGSAEWRALPWWEQRNYVEQLVRHGKYEPGGDDDGEPSIAELRQSGMQILD